jgi:hypothetical protein
MSWRPPYENETQARDARLDPYRERAAILTSRADRDATLFLRMETYWTHTRVICGGGNGPSRTRYPTVT